MNPHTQTLLIDGPVGVIDIAVDRPSAAARGVALVAHPHPLYGGTRDNKVVTTIARACVQHGYAAVRPNFRGIGESAGSFDHGKGEMLDMAALVEQFRVRYPAVADKKWVVGGFSFGTSIAVQLYARWEKEGKRLPDLMVLAGSAALRFRHGDAKAPADALIVHGEDDDVVPLTELMEWARPLDMPVVVMPNAGHYFHGKLLILRNMISTRLKSV